MNILKNADSRPLENRETELKLLVAPADVAVLRRHPFLREHAIAEPHTQALTSTYYDTPDLRIRHGGASLRLRTLENGFMQTLKDGAPCHAGLHDRSEWESTVPTPALDLQALRTMVGRKTHWGKLLREFANDDTLRPVFDTNVTRTTWLLRLSDGDEIEVALDVGSIDHDDLHAAVSEIELELKSGDAGCLYRVAQELSASAPLRLGNVSKAERGYALCFPDTASDAIRKAVTVELTRNMTLHAGFQAIVGECLAHVEANASGVENTTEPEYVHQMRIGLRRLHGAQQLFAPLMPAPARFDKEFAWLGERLGAARDWDVLCLSTLPAIQAGVRDDIGVGALAHAAAAQAAKARHKAATAIASRRYARLMLDFSGWVHGVGTPDLPADASASGRKPALQKFADAVLTKARKRLVKRAMSVVAGDPALVHRVRIAAKKSRYATEFFRSLYAQKSVDAFLKNLTALQDTLGTMNDAVVADGLLQELVAADARLVPASAFARGYLAADVTRLHHDFSKIDAQLPHLQ